MQNIFKAMAIAAIGCLCASSLPARAAAPLAARAAIAGQETLTFKIIRNGQSAGICTVTSIADLDAVVTRLGPGTYVFMGTGAAERRIIVYQTNSLTGGGASATADRRIIVY